MSGAPRAWARDLGAVALAVAATLGGGCRCGAGQPGPPPAPGAPRPATSGARRGADHTLRFVPCADAAVQSADDVEPAPRTARPGQHASAPADAPAVAKGGPEPPIDRTATPPPGQTPPGVRRRGGRLDIDVHRMDVRQLLQGIAQATHTNLVLFQEVKGTVTVQLGNQPLATALEVVARAVGCSAHRSGGMVIVRCD